jgi:zinc-ribbon domain
MFCSKCGTETPDDSQFCGKCGKALSVTSTSTGATAAVARAPVAAKPKPNIRTPFIVAALLIALFLIVAAFNGRRTSMVSNRNASAVDQLVKQKHTLTIDKPDLTVGSTGYNFFKLEVPDGATSVHLEGNFTASGGTGNDVEVYVLPENDFVNWQNRHQAKTYYNSGKVTVGNFSVNLPSDAGTYYLVLDNRFSLLSKKEVEVKGALTYYQ